MFNRIKLIAKFGFNLSSLAWISLVLWGCLWMASPMMGQTVSYGEGNATLRVGVKHKLKTTHYTAVDIEGRPFSVDSILRAGKFILIDFSFAYCGPCWEIHQSGVLEKLYKLLGAQGTNQLEIFWVEALGSPASSIRGEGDNTQGNWTKDAEGNKVPYPLFSDATLHKELGIFYPGSAPYFVLLTPSGEYVECREEVCSPKEDFYSFRQLLATFLTESDPPALVRFKLPETLFLGETISIKGLYKSISPISSVHWEISSDLCPSDRDQEEVTIKCETPGEYSVKFTVTNKNGSTTVEKKIQVLSRIEKFPFFCGMDDKSQMDFGWRSFDCDDDGYGFDSFGGFGLIERVSGTGLSSPYGAEGSKDCLVSWGNFYPEKVSAQKYYGSEISPDNMLVSAPIQISLDASKPVFSFYLRNFLDDSRPDEIQVSIRNRGLLDKPNFAIEKIALVKTTKEWQQVLVDLSPYKGQTVWIALLPIVYGKSGIMVDQLNVSMDGTLSNLRIEEERKVSVYPNPIQESLNVNTERGAVISLVTLQGEVLSRVTAQEETTRLDVSAMPIGKYLLYVELPNQDVRLHPIIIMR